MTVEKDMCSVEVYTEGKKNGEGYPRRNPMTRDGQFVSLLRSDMTTMYEVIMVSGKLYGNHVCQLSSYILENRPCLGKRTIDENGLAGPYEFMSYGEVLEEVKQVAAGIASFSLPEQAIVGIYSNNCPRWQIAEYASYCSNLCVVALYDTLGIENMIYIGNQTEMSVCFASAARCQSLLAVAAKLEKLKTVVCMDDNIEEDLKEGFSKLNIHIMTIDQLKEAGKTISFEPRPPKPQDLCTICFTSGTSGVPKGVMLPHRAIIANCAALLANMAIGLHVPNESPKYMDPIGPDDVHFSYLPLAHTFEFAVNNMMIMVGASIGYYQGDIQKLMDDMVALQPTWFITVPRLLNRIHDRIMSSVKQGGILKRFLFHTALNSKLAAMESQQALVSSFWDRIVFDKIRAKLGGRVRTINVGSAPITEEILTFSAAVLAAQIHHGYGLTETSACCSVTPINGWFGNTVGLPMPSCEIKLIDVPELGYTSLDKPHPRGEVAIKGVCVFKGYFNNLEATKEVLGSDGWFKSGDIGEWDDKGRLRIIDRKKNIFKLAQGEYIAVEKVEQIIARNQYIAQAYVDGDSLHDRPMSVVVPDFEALIPWAVKNNIADTSEMALARNPAVGEFLVQQIAKLGSRGSKELLGFEVPARIYIENEAFSIENDLLTPTFKIKRHEARKKYKAMVAEMYADLDVSQDNHPRLWTSFPRG